MKFIVSFIGGFILLILTPENWESDIVILLGSGLLSLLMSWGLAFSPPATSPRLHYVVDLLERLSTWIIGIFLGLVLGFFVTVLRSATEGWMEVFQTETILQISPSSDSDGSEIDASDIFTILEMSLFLIIGTCGLAFLPFPRLFNRVDRLSSYHKIFGLFSVTMGMLLGTLSTLGEDYPLIALAAFEFMSLFLWIVLGLHASTNPSRHLAVRSLQKTAIPLGTSILGALGIVATVTTDPAWYTWGLPLLVASGALKSIFFAFETFHWRRSTDNFVFSGWAIAAMTVVSTCSLVVMLKWLPSLGISSALLQTIHDRSIVSVLVIMLVSLALAALRKAGLIQTISTLVGLASMYPLLLIIANSGFIWSNVFDSQKLLQIIRNFAEGIGGIFAIAVVLASASYARNTALVKPENTTQDIPIGIQVVLFLNVIFMTSPFFLGLRFIQLLSNPPYIIAFLCVGVSAISVFLVFRGLIEQTQAVILAKHSITSEASKVVLLILALEAAGFTVITILTS